MSQCRPRILMCPPDHFRDRHVFLNRASSPLKTALTSAGFSVHEVDLSEFLKAGGSAKCLTLKLSEPR